MLLTWVVGVVVCVVVMVSELVSAEVEDNDMDSEAGSEDSLVRGVIPLSCSLSLGVAALKEELSVSSSSSGFLSSTLLSDEEAGEACST